MKSITKLFVTILICHSSNADLLSNTFSFISKTSEQVTSSVSGNIQSFVNATSNLSASTLLKSLTITEDGVLNLNSLIQTLNLPDNVDVKSILSSLNISVSEDGQVDLKNIFQNFNLTNVNISDVLNLFNVNTANGLLDFSHLIQNIASYASLSDYISTLIVDNTEDGLLDFAGLAQKYCGPVTQYNVTTADGYILDIYRIAGEGKVVLISHGVLSSSDDFIILGNTSLVCMLVQSGFDVWVINYRGNRYSRRHVQLDPDTDRSFWNYSMHELGCHDLSAVIDFALDTTGRNQLFLIGHSEGTSTGFILTSTTPEYNELIEKFVALSPVAYLSDSGLALTTLIRAGPVLNELFLAFGIEEVLGYDSLSRKLFQFICSQGTVGYDLCYNVLFAALVGYNPYEMEPEMFRTVLKHFPAGTCRKNLIHYSQVGNSDRFAQFDYGSKNVEHYGSAIAPEYDLSKVSCKVSMYMSRNDKIVGLKAAERIKNQLPNVVNYYIVESELFNHVDFEYARNAHTLLYEQVISELSAGN